MLQRAPLQQNHQMPASKVHNTFRTIALNILWKVTQVILWASASLLLMLIFCVFMLQTAFFQTKATHWATSYLQQKTGANIQISAIRFDFDGAVHIKNLFVPAENGDTLLLSKDLKIKVPLLPLLQQKIMVQQFRWYGVMAAVSFDDSGRSNFDYLLAAFQTPDTLVVKQPAAATDEQPWTFVFGNIILREFDMRFADASTGIAAAAKLDQLVLTPRTIDFDNLHFGVQRFFINGLDVRYHQTHENLVGTATAAAPHLTLDLQHITLKNIQYDLRLPDGTNSNGKWQAFQLTEGHLSTKDQTVAIKKIALEHTSIFAQLPATNAVDSVLVAPTTLSFEWPEWAITVEDLHLYNLGVVAINGQPELLTGKFQPAYIRLSNFDCKAQFALQNQTAQLHLAQLNFTEGSGFQLERMQFSALLDNQHLTISELAIQTPYLALNSQTTLQFNSLDDFLNTPENTIWSTDLNLQKIAAGDLYYFTDLHLDSALEYQLMHLPKNLTVKATGSANEINLQKLTFSAMQATAIELQALVKNPFDSVQSELVHSKLRIKTKRADLQNFTAEGIPLPDSLLVQFTAFGKMDNLLAELKVASDWGQVKSNTQINLLAAQPTYLLEVAADKINLGKILQDTSLAPIGLQIAAQGAGFDAQSQGTFEINFSDLEANKYKYQPVVLKGTLRKQILQTTLSYADSNAVFALRSAITFLTDGLKGNADLDLKGINFKGLQLTEQDIRAAIAIQMQFETHGENWQATLNGSGGRILKNNQRYPISQLNIAAHSNAAGSYAKIDSDILTLLLESNLAADEIYPALERRIMAAFKPTEKAPSAAFLTIEAAVQQSKILSEVLVPGLQKLEPGTFNLHLDEANGLLDANISFPEIGYGAIELNGLRLDLDAKADSLGWALRFDLLRSAPLEMHQTTLLGTIQNNTGQFSFELKDQANDLLYQIHTALKSVANSSELRFVPEKLVLNKELWAIPEDNALIFSDKSMAVRNLHIRNDKQHLGLETSQYDSTRLDFIFNGFSLAAITALANAQERLLDGRLDGVVSILKPKGNTAFLADITIDDLVLMGAPTGTLTLVAENLTRNMYNLRASIAGGGLELDTRGTYSSLDGGNYFDVTAHLDRADLAVFEVFTNAFLTETSGFLSGDFTAKGFLNALKYQGHLQFNKARFTVKDLNTAFELSEERIELRATDVGFQNFKMRDRQGNTATLNGKIDLKNPALPEFDLRLNSKNYQLLNSKREHNGLFFGDLIVDVSLRLTGNPLLPNITTIIRLNKGTTLTFIVPESELAEIERDGVVQFENMRAPLDPLTAFDAAAANNTALKGLKIQAQLEVDRETVFRVIVDERSGDYLQMQGKAELLFGLSANGRMTLFGQYEVREGRYELSFYDLVRRRFDFKEGSTINWTGDPLGAALDLSAIYNVRASARELMAAQLTGVDEATRTKYNQKLPFEVFLNIKGAITAPEISFKLDMPQNSRGELGGNVYAQVQQLNEDESQLNKQVSALLILGGFIPETGGTAGGAATSMVRSSVSQLISDQLNTLSNKYIKGIDIDLGLNSYTDYRTGAAQDRTQLNVNVSKQLLNDRLLISVGSNLDLEGQSAQNQRGVSEIIGNVNVEYLLSSDGRYRLKAFRKNQFEGVLDGQIVTTGVSLRYSKEFNRFWEIFKAIKEQETVIVEDLKPIEEPEQPSQKNPKQATPINANEPKE